MRIQGYTEGYKRTQEDTGVSRRIQGFTGGYRTLQLEDTGGYR